MRGVQPGKYRHRITIQRPHSAQTLSGETFETWVTVYQDVPAAIEPLSVREFISAQAVQSQVTVRIEIRYLPGLTADMRILHGDKVYNPEGWLADRVSGTQYLTAPCVEVL